MRTSLLSAALLVAGFGVASAQQPGQPGAQPDRQPGQAQPGQQQPGQPGQQQPGQQQPGQQQPGQQDRDQIAAAGQSQSGDFLTSMEQNMLRTDELERADLVDSQGEDIGNIAGVLIDHQSGEAKGVVVNMGGVAGVGARTVALSWDAIEISSQEEGGAFAGSGGWEVRTQMSQQELENAPEFEESDDQVAFDQ